MGRDVTDADCRVLNWNVWGRGPGHRHRLSLLVDCVRRVAPDLATFQEAVVDADVDHPAVLAEAAGLDVTAWGPRPGATPDAPAPAGSRFGLAVASRWPIVHRQDVRLPGRDGPSDRTALGVLVAHPRGLLPLVTTHLVAHPARSAVRSEQLRAVTGLVLDLVAAGGELAPIVTGDLNAEPDSDEVRRFLGLRTPGFVEDVAFQDAWRLARGDAPGWTWRRENPHVDPTSPEARIDYVALELHGRVVDARLVGGDPADGWPSDHAGVVADLRP